MCNFYFSMASKSHKSLKKFTLSNDDDKTFSSHWELQLCKIWARSELMALSNHQYEKKNYLSVKILDGFPSAALTAYGRQPITPLGFVLTPKKNLLMQNFRCLRHFQQRKTKQKSRFSAILLQVCWLLNLYMKPIYIDGDRFSNLPLVLKSSKSFKNRDFYVVFLC